MLSVVNSLESMKGVISTIVQDWPGRFNKEGVDIKCTSCSIQDSFMNGGFESQHFLCIFQFPPFFWTLDQLLSSQELLVWLPLGQRQIVFLHFYFQPHFRSLFVEIISAIVPEKSKMDRPHCRLGQRVPRPHVCQQLATEKKLRHKLTRLGQARLHKIRTSLPTETVWKQLHDGEIFSKRWVKFAVFVALYESIPQRKVCGPKRREPCGQLRLNKFYLWTKIWNNTLYKKKLVWVWQELPEISTKVHWRWSSAYTREWYKSISMSEESSSSPEYLSSLKSLGCTTTQKESNANLDHSVRTVCG